MEAILKFSLPEEEEEFDAAKNGLAWQTVATQFDDWLRSEVKYRGQTRLQEVREKLRAYCDEYGVTLE